MLNPFSIIKPRKRSRALLSLMLGIIGLAGSLGQSSLAAETNLDPMPPQLETRFALSALPPALRDRATVYLLDPRKGYQLSRKGTNGLACLVQRTAWEHTLFRNDIYIPLCYDAVGTKTYLQVIMDTAALRAQGMSPAAVHTEVTRRYREKIYKAPEKAGMSYMLSPIMRTVALHHDMKVFTMAMPHLMPYAPGITNDDIGAAPDFSKPPSPLYPFIDKQGNSEQSYIILPIGDAETAKIVNSEKSLIDDLCAYQKALCLSHGKH